MVEGKMKGEGKWGRNGRCRGRRVGEGGGTVGREIRWKGREGGGGGKVGREGGKVEGEGGKVEGEGKWRGREDGRWSSRLA